MGNVCLGGTMNGEKRWVRKFSYFPTGEEGVKLVESETPYTWKISAQVKFEIHIPYFYCILNF